MSDLDDQILRDRLQRLAGRLPDEQSAYAALQARVRQVKRRRAMVGTTGLVIACVVGLAFAAFAGRDHHTVTTATDDVTVPDVSTAAATATTAAVRSTTTSTMSPETSTSASTTTAVVIDTTVVEMAPPVIAPGPTVITAKPSSGANGGSTSGNPAPQPTPSPASTAPFSTGPFSTEPAATDASPPSTAAPVAETRTFTAAHGSITVRLRDGRLELLDHRAASDYDFRVDRNDAERIQVRFRSDQATSQIDVSIDNGHISGSIDEQTAESNAATPTTYETGSGGWDDAPSETSVTSTPG